MQCPPPKLVRGVPEGYKLYTSYYTLMVKCIRRLEHLSYTCTAKGRLYTSYYTLIVKCIRRVEHLSYACTARGDCTLHTTL